MKKILHILVILAMLAALVYALRFPAHTFRTYTDPASGFSFEYPRELVATPIPRNDGEASGVSFSDTVGGPFIISVQSMSTERARSRVCSQPYTENPDNDPGIREIRIDQAGRSLVITSRSTSAFLRIQQAAGLR